MELTSSTVHVVIASATGEAEVALPAQVPLALVMADLLELLDVSTGEGRLRPPVLIGPTGAPLDASASPASLGIPDGAVLVLQDAAGSTASGEPAAPVDDPLALLLTSTPTTGAPARDVHRGAAAIATLAVTLFAAVGWAASGTAPVVAAASASALLAVALAFSAPAIARLSAPFGRAAVTGAVASAAAAGAGFVRIGGNPDHVSLMAFGAAGGATVVAGALVALTPGLRTSTVAWTTGSALLAVACGVWGWLPERPTAAAGVLLALGATGLALAPRFTTLLTRLSPPPVELLSAAQDEAWEPPTREALRARLDDARDVLCGFMIGAAGATAAGAVAFLVAAPADRSVPAGLSAGAIAAVLALRARWFDDHRTVLALVVSAVAVAALATIALASAGHSGTAGGMAVLLGAASLVPLWLGRPSVTPMTRRAFELLEYGLILAAVPAVLWIAGVFALVRSL